MFWHQPFVRVVQTEDGGEVASTPAIVRSGPDCMRRMQSMSATKYEKPTAACARLITNQSANSSSRTSRSSLPSRVGARGRQDPDCLRAGIVCTHPRRSIRLHRADGADSASSSAPDRSDHSTRHLRRTAQARAMRTSRLSERQRAFRHSPQIGPVVGSSSLRLTCSRSLMACTRLDSPPCTQKTELSGSDRSSKVNVSLRCQHIL